MKIRRLRKELAEKLGVTPGAITKRIKKLDKKSNHTLGSKDEIAAALAMKAGLNVRSRLEKSEISRVEGIARRISSLPVHEEKTDKEKLQEYESEISRLKDKLNRLRPYDLDFESFGLSEIFRGGTEKCWKSNHYDGMVQDATKALEIHMNKKLGETGLTGVKVVNDAKERNVFKMKKPSEEQGLYFLFGGAVLWFRNKSHHQIPNYSKEEAISIVLYLDYLAKLFNELCKKNEV